MGQVVVVPHSTAVGLAHPVRAAAAGRATREEEAADRKLPDRTLRARTRAATAVPAPNGQGVQVFTTAVVVVVVAASTASGPVDLVVVVRDRTRSHPVPVAQLLTAPLTLAAVVVARHQVP